LTKNNCQINLSFNNCKFSQNHLGKKYKVPIEVMANVWHLFKFSLFQILFKILIYFQAFHYFVSKKFFPLVSLWFSLASEPPPTFIAAYTKERMKKLKSLIYVQTSPLLILQLLQFMCLLLMHSENSFHCCCFFLLNSATDVGHGWK
jgi:hypothetical protein